MKKISDYYAQFVAENRAKGLAPATHEYYATALKYFFDYLESKKIKKISQITPESVLGYTAHLYECRITNSSISSYLRAARRFIIYLGTLHAIKPFRVHIPKSQEIFKDYFTHEEVKRIFISSEDNEQAWIISVLLLGTGLRAATLAALKVRDISFDTCSIILRTTKTKKVHVLPLTPFLLHVLKKHIAGQSLHADDYLFRTSTGTAYTRHTLWRALERFLKSRGINKTGIHIFRHTFARLMVLNGCDAFTLQKWLTHSSIEQSKQYVTLYSSDLAATMYKYNPTAHLK